MSTAPARSRSDIAVDLFPFLRVYNDGRTKIFVRHTTVPASSSYEKSRSGVITKDIIIDGDTGVYVRVFLPVDAAASAAAAGRRLPLVVYVHGGGFCTGSASSKIFHRYAESLSSRAAAVVVSVDYRLAPEFPIPAAYDDAWLALRWAASAASSSEDDWVETYADRSCVFLAGESSGANIVHNVALRSNDIDIEGIILLQPCFWGTERLPCETPDATWLTSPPMLLPERIDNLYPYMTAGAAGNDDPRINPPAEAIASLPCRRALVAVATEDTLRGRGRLYFQPLRDAPAWGGVEKEATLVESKGVDHCFHLLPKFSSHNETKLLMDHVAKFIAKGKTPPISMLMMEERDGVTKKMTSIAVPPRCMAAQTAVLGVGRGVGLGMGNMRPLSKAQKYHFCSAALGRTVFKSYL